MAKLPSRNRRFNLYEDPELRRALNAQRLLEAIRRDLEAPGPRTSLSVRPVRIGPQLRYRLEYDDAAMSCSRTCFLTPRELDLLQQLMGDTGGRLLQDDARDAAG